MEEDTADYRSNNARHDCHCVSDLAPSKMDFQASPRGGAEADFEALMCILISKERKKGKRKKQRCMSVHMSIVIV